MAVVEGDFEKPNLLRAITKALGEAELSDNKQGNFFMVIDTPERMAFLTNQETSGEALMLLELAKMTLVQTQYEKGED